MKKTILSVLALCLNCLLLHPSCSKNKNGACTISCGGYGTSQPFTSTTYAFKTREECEQLGKDRAGSCKASYCPPTGNSDDCYQVYP